MCPRMLLNRVSNLNDIRSAIYDALQRLAFRDHDKSNTGELIYGLTADIARLQNFFCTER